MIVNINLDKTNVGNSVDEITKKLSDEEAYNLATYLLSKLESKGYCIWQTYSKEDVKMFSGKEDLVKEDAYFKAGGAHGVVRKDKAIQVIVGLEVPKVRDFFDELRQK